MNNSEKFSSKKSQKLRPNNPQIKAFTNFYTCDGRKMWYEVFSPRNEIKGEIDECYFYQTLSIYVYEVAHTNFT